jgi:hypothetical protein
MRLFLSDPRRTPFRRVAFQLHLCAGLGIVILMVVMGLTGSAIALRERFACFCLGEETVQYLDDSRGIKRISNHMRTFSQTG